MPFTRKIDDKNYVLPCGKCPKCLSRRVSGWSFRLMEEEKRCSSSHFITLTYENAPITKSGFMTLQKRDLQLFIKRLRKLNQNKLKYFVCGEYGGKTMRPHYHMILFNCNIETISEAWKIPKTDISIGFVHYGKVSKASVGYTLKYMCKQGKIPVHKNDDRNKEFQLMSKGLGLSYINPSTKKYHTQDLENRMCLNIEDGKKISMPRYYKNKLYTEEQRQIIKEYFEEKSIQNLIEIAWEYNSILRDWKEAREVSYNNMYKNSKQRD